MSNRQDGVLVPILPFFTRKPRLQPPVDKGLEETVRSVTMEEASSFLEYNESSSRLISIGVMVCILSPIVLILLAGLAEQERITMNASVAGAVGTALLLIMVAAAVGVFIREGMRGKKFWGDRIGGVSDLEFCDNALGGHLDRLAGGRRFICRISGDHEGDCSRQRIKIDRNSIRISPVL